jgi:hypothetical protein
MTCSPVPAGPVGSRMTASLSAVAGAGFKIGIGPGAAAPGIDPPPSRFPQPSRPPRPGVQARGATAVMTTMPGTSRRPPLKSVNPPVTVTGVAPWAFGVGVSATAASPGTAAVGVSAVGAAGTPGPSPALSSSGAGRGADRGADRGAHALAMLQAHIARCRPQVAPLPSEQAPCTCARLCQSYPPHRHPHTHTHTSTPLIHNTHFHPLSCRPTPTTLATRRGQGVKTPFEHPKSDGRYKPQQQHPLYCRCSASMTSHLAKS